MINYEIYKFLHLAFIIFTFTIIGLSFEKSKILSSKKILFLQGLIIFLIFVSGMGLIARLGYKHNEIFPLWIKLKLSLWFLFSFLVLLLNKLHKFKNLILSLIFIIALILIFVVINKPI